MVHFWTIVLSLTKLRRLASLEIQWKAEKCSGSLAGCCCWLQIPAPLLLAVTPGLSPLLPMLGSPACGSVTLEPCRNVLKSLTALTLTPFEEGPAMEQDEFLHPQVSFLSFQDTTGDAWERPGCKALQGLFFISCFALIKHDFASPARDHCLSAFLRLLTTHRKRP